MQFTGVGWEWLMVLTVILTECGECLVILYSQGVWGWFMTIGQQGHNTWHGDFAPILSEIKRAADMTMLPSKDSESIAIFSDEFFSGILLQQQAH